MLEFLGMEEEAARVLLCFSVLGVCVGVPGGNLAASGESGSWKQTAVGVICTVVGVAAAIYGCLPAIALFFTFQWNVLLKGLFYACLTGAAGYGVGYWATMSGRKRKYKKNPIMKEAVAYCRENGIVAVQCFEDRLRFFQDLENREYCEKYVEKHMAADIIASNSFRKGWTRPAAWCDYDHPRSFAGDIVFADRGWPNIPDLDIFAGVLARQLGGCRIAEHTQRDQYDTSKWEGSTHVTTHNITLMYTDRFVYKMAAYSSKFPEQEKQRKEKTPAVKGNSWE